MNNCQEENINSLEVFMNSIKRVNESRKHKVKNSYGVYDGFKYYRKNRPKEHKYVLTESQYFSIIRKVNSLLSDLLVSGEDVTLPCRLGRLELRKYEAKIVTDGKKIRTNLPIDWDRTLKLWYEDEESYKNKILIKVEEKEIYKVFYNRSVANFTNKTFYEFNVNRDIKKRLKQNIKEGKLDAFTI